MSRCKACGQEIIWIKTKTGKMMPCDAESVIYWRVKGGSKTIVLGNGKVVRGELEGTPGEAVGTGYLSHFATCPAADQFRRR